MEAEGEIEGEADGDYEDGMQEGEEEVETGEEEVHTVDEEDDNDVVIVGKVTCQTVFYLDQMHELGITRVLPDFSSHCINLKLIQPFWKAAFHLQQINFILEDDEEEADTEMVSQDVNQTHQDVPTGTVFYVIINICSHRKLLTF